MTGTPAEIVDVSAYSSREGKVRFPRPVALQVARELCQALKPVCERLIVAGSLRRRKTEVGDVEILYIPKHDLAAGGELFETQKNLADLALEDLLRRFVLKKRLNANGSEMYGPKNKFLVHTLSKAPVDLFAATPTNWHNYLVCRTGGAESNVNIAARARARGYKWNPYGEGFTRLSDGESIPMASEEAVFDFVGIPYPQPWERR